MTISRFTDKKRKTEAEMSPPAPLKEPAPVKVKSASVKKKEIIRKPRPFRMFRYRNVAFIYTQEGDKAIIQAYNDETREASPPITVKLENAKQAMQILAKIILSERELDSLLIQEKG